MKDKLLPSNVVFMYSEPDLETYKAYGATVLGWGGARTLDQVRELADLGVHSTGSMWCLTAGAENLHKSADLREATAKDIEGNPVPVPWLWDHAYEGTPSWFGCTNHPTFRAHVRAEVCHAMAGGADGLHVDDHKGTASALLVGGGGFCDYCMAAFTDWLQAHSTPERLAAAGVDTFEGLDYRTLVRRYASTREEFMKVRESIPLYHDLVDCQLQLAAENTRQLGALASDIIGRPATLSANAGLGNPASTAVIPNLTWVICEAKQGAPDVPDGLHAAIRVYRTAEAVGKPVAVTAAGHDWAYVKEHGTESLVRIWIALAYACGQRFMAPSTHQWCFTKEKGTHWYQARTEAYAPLYRFVRQYPRLFDGLATRGPLMIPAGVPERFDTYEQRDLLADLLDQGEPKPLYAGENIWVFPREAADGSRAVLHLVNVAYATDDIVSPQADVDVSLVSGVLMGCYKTARMYAYDAPPIDLSLLYDGDVLGLRVPSLRQWAIIELLA